MKTSLKLRAKRELGRATKRPAATGRHMNESPQKPGLEAVVQRKAPLSMGENAPFMVEPEKVSGDDLSTKASVASYGDERAFRPLPNAFPTSELPQNYGITRIVLVVRDPLWVYAYWEITDHAKSTIMESSGRPDGNEVKYTLRIRGGHSPGQNDNDKARVGDIEVDQTANHWYIQVPQPNRAYLVEIGVIGLTGTFHLIARSNKVRMPRDWVNDSPAHQWIDPDYGEILKMSGEGKQLLRGYGSASVIEEISRRQEALV